MIGNYVNNWPSPTGGIAGICAVYACRGRVVIFRSAAPATFANGAILQISASSVVIPKYSGMKVNDGMDRGLQCQSFLLFLALYLPN